MSSLNRILRIVVSFGMPALVIGGAYLVVHDAVALGALSIIGGIVLVAVFAVQNRSEKERSRRR
jgi:uncharacterized MnhB-related membrane protein